jgi:site-specific DNA-methyltransferase (adenine-specific)
MTKLNRVIFSSKSPHYATPKKLYKLLDEEFHFNDDPCPIGNDIDGLMRSWGETTFCNPPYGKNINKWLMKAYMESLNGKIIVLLVPSRTDTKWWHDWAMLAQEIRFIKGRLQFENSIFPAPFPSTILVFRPKNWSVIKQ